MSAAILCLVAFAASVLTFFSGFGLGTLLLPAFAVFYPIEVAVASTAIVHLFNGLLKLVLVGRHADRSIVFRFGLPATVAAFFGAWLLIQLSDMRAIAQFSVLGLDAAILPAKFVVGVLLLLVTLAELLPGLESASLPPRFLPLGGLLSGFFGGLSGMQGALRSVFLIRSGLSPAGYIATSAVAATLVDVSRLAVYGRSLLAQRGGLDYPILAAAVTSAFAGAVLGARLLPKVSLKGLQRGVGFLLLVVALGLMLGVL